METVLEVKNLIKKYGDLTAVDDISFNIEKGEIFGLLGPNGAGKTTTIEMIEGLRKPDSGSIKICGIDVLRNPEKIKEIIGAQILHRYLVIIVQTIILLAVGIFAFNIRIGGNYFYFWLVLTFGAICFLSIGFALASLIKSTRSATPICMIVFFLMLFLGGIFFPVSIMPNFLVIFSKILPSTHLSDALRIIIIEGKGLGSAWSQLAVMGGWVITSLIVSIRFFRWE